MCNYQRFGAAASTATPEWLAARKNSPTVTANSSTRWALITGTRSSWPATQGVGDSTRPRDQRRRHRPDAPRPPASLTISAKVDAYGIYARFDFRVPLAACDTYTAYMIRLEMRESIKILQQRSAISGPARSWTRRRSSGLPPEGRRSLRRIEARKARSVSTSSATAARILPLPASGRLPSFNLTVLEDMCLGQTIADAVIISAASDVSFAKWIGDHF